MLIFDKSTLQALSVDESVWLENFFLTNITPLFYVESLADLEKSVAGKTPEQVVGNLAEKSPTNGTFSNIYHHTLVVNDLLGNHVEMNKRAVIKEGQPRKSPNGTIGIYYEQFPEEAALQRWKDREFLEVERKVAKQWRQALSNQNFDSLIAIVKNIVPKDAHFSSLDEVKAFVDKFAHGKDRAIIDLALLVLDIPDELKSRVVKRWENGDHKSIQEFAPYAAFVLKIDLLFYLSVDKRFISISHKGKPTNKIDLAYLYYLPFCRIFVSNDNLHVRLAPLFMTNGQLFINGQDLKTGLKELDDYYSNFPGHIKAQGTMKFAPYPPRDVDTFVTRIWDQLSSSWRKDAEEKDNGIDLPPDEDLIKHLNRLEKDAKPIANSDSIPSDEASHIVIQRYSSAKKGRWRVLPKEVEN